MALINCPECNQQISDKATSCPKCGCPISSQSNNNIVEIYFPHWQSGTIRGKCSVLEYGQEIATCRSGETVTIECSSPRKITVTSTGCIKSAEQEVSPGEKYKIGLSGFAKLYFTRVTSIT